MIRAKRHFSLSVTLILVTSVALTGCEPLRKKFVRQKKKDKSEDFIPVLDPIDYPASRVHASEKYAYHFSMWQVWSKDLRLLLVEDGMDKRKRYLMAQMVGQLNEMKKWTPEAFLAKVDEALQNYDRLQKEFDKPESMRNQSFVEAQLRRIESFLRNDLDPDIVYVEAQPEE